MNGFWLTFFPVDEILSVHIGNLNMYAAKKNTNFEKLWNTYALTGSCSLSELDIHISNLVLTYGKDSIETWLKKNSKKTA